MTKQEYIQQAYGEYWDKVKDYVDEDGWIVDPFYYGTTYPNEAEFFDQLLAEVILNILCESPSETAIKYRPVALKEVEHNNGWISINNTTYPKSSDFLNETRVLCYKKEMKEVTCGTFNEYWKLQRDFGRFTHYQLIEKPKPPLYE